MTPPPIPATFTEISETLHKDPDAEHTRFRVAQYGWIVCKRR